jgi:hypothetical protein
VVNNTAGLGSSLLFLPGPHSLVHSPYIALLMVNFELPNKGHGIKWDFVVVCVGV